MRKMGSVPISLFQALLQGVEGGLEYALPDLPGERAFALGGAVELGPPLGEGAVAVGHRGELERGDIVLHAHRALENRVAALVVVVREREELLADHAAVAQTKVAHAADAVRRHVVLDARLGDERRPLRQAVEVAHLRPHRVGRRFDHARGVDLDQGFLPSSRAFAALPRSPPCTPISRSSWSTSGAWARKRSAEFTTLSAMLPFPLVPLLPPLPPPRPSTCSTLMPSMRSIGLTDSRMMPSSLSISWRRIADWRASGVSRLAALFISVRPSASTSWRTFAASERMREVSASASALETSISFFRCASSTSRTVKTFSSSATALARAWSAEAWASDWTFDCSATAIARCCSASSIACRRVISSSWIACSRSILSCSTARSETDRK